MTKEQVEAYIEKRQKIKIKLISQYGSKCVYCDKELPIQSLTLDHIYPASKEKKRKRAWLMQIGKLVLACATCNRKKADRIVSIEDFRKERMGDKYIPLDYYESKYKKKKQARKEKMHGNNFNTKVGAKNLSKKEKYPVFEGYRNIVYPENPVIGNIRDLKKLKINVDKDNLVREQVGYNWFQKVIHSLSNMLK